ncbi:signal transduction histidine kinase [Aneurinibacillus soli]|uniref:histidine kinase n=1 Tax=Aneurinibacillus soli TaxID=1500254 RepID=A0A0U5B1U7_9BACL|nr:HAMP domain-containing sensor histidine kinase [Aneurinibacillus soli]PYE62249.1 signal transduction histidine kinase [Aneurinibacillus soli]BAU28562.1 Sensor histidine kinase YycG [Aneurinibacillus soli]
MSIKVRLLLSYIAMLIVPVVLTIVVALILTVTNVGSIRNLTHLGETEQNLLQEGAKIFTDIKVTADQNPEQLKSSAYLAKLDQKLSIINTGIIVRQDNDVIYASKLFNGEDIVEHLPRFGHHHEETHDPEFIGNHLYLIKQHDFHFKNKQAGSIFLLTNVGPIGQFAHKLIIMMGFAVILIIICTNGILTYTVSRSIIKPLRSLKKAAEQIKEGNLSFAMEPYRKDEIGELAAAFEEMRLRLKASVEQQLQYENNRKELISSISHDLKTPITAIKGYVEGIMDGVADSSEKRERYMKTIYTKANDLDKLIEQLFLFSKLDVKKLPFNFENIDMNRYVADCTEEMQFDIERSGITLTYHTDIEEPLIVIADRENLKRVMTNIVENAVKYMKRENGTIDVYITANQEMVTIKVQDNGQGISGDRLPFIFDIFYRADVSRNSATGGSGLGLAIAKRIIEEHGGRIWAESIEGKGTNILFTLKRVQVEKRGEENGENPHY